MEKNDNEALQLRVHFDIGWTHQDPHRLWYQYKDIVLYCFRCQKAVIEIEIETVQKECSDNLNKKMCGEIRTLTCDDISPTYPI